MLLFLINQYWGGNQVTDLERAVINRNKAAAELLKAIREDARIADNMKDYWCHQVSDTER